MWGIVVWLKRSKAKHSCRKSENTRVAQCRTKELLDQRIPLHFCSLKMKLAWLMGLYRIAESGYISHLQQMVTFLMQDGKFGNFPSFGEKGIFWWRKNTLFYYIIFSHWFFFFFLIKFCVLAIWLPLTSFGSVIETNKTDFWKDQYYLAHYWISKIFMLKFLTLQLSFFGKKKLEVTACEFISVYLLWVEFSKFHRW